MAQVRLLGPDLPNPLTISVEPSMTIAQLKERALAEWPASSGAQAAARACASRQRAGGLARHARRAAPRRRRRVPARRPRAGDPPQLAQLKIIHQGRFLGDEKALRGACRAEAVPAHAPPPPPPEPPEPP